jgi:glycosyltransferase involved in cell wall biosynthesis
MTETLHNPEAQRPLVSVIVPTRNRAELLRRSIASVLAQTYTRLELIVVNDASTDHTREVLAQIADPRLRVIHREVNKGAAAARNAAAVAAQGEYLAFQDDDDCWLVEKLEKQLRALLAAPPEVGWCLGGHISVDEGRTVYIGGKYYFGEIDYSRGTGNGGPDFHLIATPNWLVRRELFMRAGMFDERMRSWDDWELGLRLDQITRRIHVDEPLFLQSTAGGMMKAERARGGDMRIIMEKHGELWRKRRRVRARHWYIIGRAESLYDPEPAGRRELWKSVAIWPFAPLPWAGLLMSYLGLGFTQRLTMRFRRLKKLWE